MPAPAYVAAVAAIALLAALTVSLLPLHPATGITAGVVAALLAQVWLPCPCHRKDHRP